MVARSLLVRGVVLALVCLSPRVALAEPHLLARQYTRCTTCHVSPSGGGQLTPYGRSLSNVELSTFTAPGSDDPTVDEPGEEAFLFGLLGASLGPLALGVDLRPSRLHISQTAFEMSRNLLMTADVTASVRQGSWLVYGEAGRKLRNDRTEFDSQEYWAGWVPEQGLGIRGGRFLPAYGVRFADHTAYNRAYLQLAQYDQVLGVEVSLSNPRYLVQASVGPGLADATIDDDGRQAFTATGRVQVDLSPRAVVVGSGLFRNQSDRLPRRGSTGVAVGLAPGPRLTTWTQFDAVFEDGNAEATYVLTHEMSVEVIRGLWVKVSPQALLGGGDRVSDLGRLALSAVFLPRTHWNVNVSYYRDRNRVSETTTKTVLLQLHLYL